MLQLLALRLVYQSQHPYQPKEDALCVMSLFSTLQAVLAKLTNSKSWLKLTNKLPAYTLKPSWLVSNSVIGGDGLLRRYALSNWDVFKACMRREYIIMKRNSIVFGFRIAQVSCCYTGILY